MSDNCTQAENLKEKNTGDPAKEFDHEETADDSILNSDGELVSGQRRQQLGHSSRKRSHSQIDNTNLRKGKQPLKKMNRQPKMNDRNTSNKRPRHLASNEILYRGLVSSITQATPGTPNLKNILMSKWHLIQNQPLLREIFREPPIVSYKKGKSLKDILVRAKL